MPHKELPDSTASHVVLRINPTASWIQERIEIRGLKYFCSSVVLCAISWMLWLSINPARRDQVCATIFVVKVTRPDLVSIYYPTEMAGSERCGGNWEDEEKSTVQFLSCLIGDENWTRDEKTTWMIDWLIDFSVASTPKNRVLTMAETVPWAPGKCIREWISKKNDDFEICRLGEEVILAIEISFRVNFQHGLRLFKEMTLNILIIFKIIVSLITA